MHLDLNGKWANSYGSIMNLLVSDDGRIFGDYSSTTGSTGQYCVIGQCSTDELEKGKGRAVVLCIYWRSIGGDAYDASWHWMSTYCGQLLEGGELSVINSLIATSTFSGFSTGDYIDKLAFRKVEGENLSTPIIHYNDYLSDQIGNPINGVWSGNNPDALLALSVVNDQYGLVIGTLEYQSQTIEMFGFTDTCENQGDLQSVNVCGYLANTSTPISLSGWLDVKNGSLKLSRWNANSTTFENRYYQSNVDTWLLSYTT